MKKLLLFLLLLSIAAPSFAKDPAWQTATLISLDQDRMPDDTNIRVTHIHFSLGEYEYFAESTIKVVWHHGPKLTENEAFKCSMDGDNLRLLDESGKQFKFRIIKRRKS